MILIPAIRQRFFDNNGVPLAGGQLFTYQAGTTTPQVTYSNQTGTTNTNPVVLDSYGYCDIWIDPTKSYKFVLEDASSNVLWTVDNVNTTNPVNANLFYAGPLSGTSAVPTFRAIGNQDLPLTVQTKTANYTAQVGDGLILCSGAAFTVTLPAANAMTGQILRVKKTDAALANIITIARAGSDTIDTLTSTSLNSNQECVLLVSDGVSNWDIVSRTYSAAVTVYTPTFIGLGTVSGTSATWQRIPGGMQLYGTTTCGTVTGSGASFTWPTGPTAISSLTSPQQLVGNITKNTSVAASFTCLVAPSDTKVQIGVQDVSYGGYTPAAGNIVFASSDTFSWTATIPMTGWN